MYLINMKKKGICIFFLLLVTVFSVFAQAEQYPRGAIFDEEAYNSLPRREIIETGSYEGLPRSFSLKQYAPLPGDQTMYGTCVAWAASYAARTICESIALNRLNQSETTQNAFSVVYVYKNIRPSDTGGVYGAQIHWALDLMTETGSVKMHDAERNLEFPSVDVSIFEDSKRYPIAGYVTLFSPDDRIKTGLVTRTVKKSLAEGKPVIIGMNTPDSFFEVKDAWNPKEDPDRYYGGHALCVVGYDDEKGAFEVLNSWGRKWGNGGYIWIPYNVFVDFVIEGYELIENIAVYSDTVRFEGYAQVERPGQNEQVPLVFTEYGYYITEDSFKRGDEIRFTVSSAESAYVYVLSVSRSAQNNIYYYPMLMFPQTGSSALLNMSENILTLPGEDKTITISSDSGIEFLITLFSKQALDIQDVMRRFASAKGNLNERLLQSIGGNFLQSISYNEAEAAFACEPESRQAVAALIVGLEVSN